MQGWAEKDSIRSQAMRPFHCTAPSNNHTAFVHGVGSQPRLQLQFSRIANHTTMYVPSGVRHAAGMRAGPTIFWSSPGSVSS